jgi:hypothetical protein
MKEHNLIPLSEIDPEARKIAVAWVEGFEHIGSFELEQKHKLASDIMNYANNKFKNILETQKKIIDTSKITDLLAGQLEQSSSKIRDLLAFLHGDGGHYTHKYGLQKSIDDAIELIGTKWFTKESDPSINNLEPKDLSDVDFQFLLALPNHGSALRHAYKTGQKDIINKIKNDNIFFEAIKDTPDDVKQKITDQLIDQLQKEIKNLRVQVSFLQGNNGHIDE